jgi:hypothetical protein
MERTCIIFLDFLNFISSYVRYIHKELMYTGYVPIYISRDVQ